MVKLFLSSSFSEVASILPEFEPNLKNKKVTFIYTASTVEDVNFYVEDGKKELENLGIIVDKLDISSSKKSEIELKLSNIDFIYISGGNTFYLLQELKRTGIDKIIINEVKFGKLYIGESAGSIILAPNIEYSKYMDDISKAPFLNSYDSLNLIDFYILPHNNEFPFEESTKKISDEYSSKVNLVKINNSEVILFSDEKFEIKKINSIKILILFI